MTAIVQGESKEQQAKIMQHFVDIADVRNPNLLDSTRLYSTRLSL